MIWPKLLKNLPFYLSFHYPSLFSFLSSFNTTTYYVSFKIVTQPCEVGSAHICGTWGWEKLGHLPKATQLVFKHGVSDSKSAFIILNVTISSVEYYLSCSRVFSILIYMSLHCHCFFTHWYLSLLAVESNRLFKLATNTCWEEK